MVVGMIFLMARRNGLIDFISSWWPIPSALKTLRITESADAIGTLDSYPSTDLMVNKLKSHGQTQSSNPWKRPFRSQNSVAHESRILVESLGLARLFLSRKVSLHSSYLVGTQGGPPRKAVADSARVRWLFRTAILTACGCPGGKCWRVVLTGMLAASSADTSGHPLVLRWFYHDGDGHGVMAVFEMIKIR
jgi:hypothetical protein